MPEGQTTHKARGLDADDIEQVEQGLLVTVRRSKADQEGKRHQTAIVYGARPETCPVCAL